MYIYIYVLCIHLYLSISIQVLHLSPTPSPQKLPRCLQTSFRWGHPSMPSNPAGGVIIPDSAHPWMRTVSEWIWMGCWGCWGCWDDPLDSQWIIPENSLRLPRTRQLMGGMISFQKHGRCSYGSEDSSRCQPNSGMICHGVCHISSNHS